MLISIIQPGFNEHCNVFDMIYTTKSDVDHPSVLPVRYLQ